MCLGRSSWKVSCAGCLPDSQRSAAIDSVELSRRFDAHDAGQRRRHVGGVDALADLPWPDARGDDDERHPGVVLVRRAMGRAGRHPVEVVRGVLQLEVGAALRVKAVEK